MSDPIARSVAAVAEIDAVPKILEVVTRATGMGFAAVARVTDERWVCCAVHDDIAFGLKPGGELELATTICNEIRQVPRAVVIDHVDEDPLFREHPTPRQYGFQSYISVPIVYDGHFFGTLCAIDPAPAKLRDSSIVGMFELFADLIGAHLAARERLKASQDDLLTAVQTAELRDQFIAILGHDLRNPLAALSGGLRLLDKSPPPEKAQMLRALMGKSITRMAQLIQDVMDFAKGQLGGGIELHRRQDAPLRAALQGVVSEFQMAEPDRFIVASFAIEAPVSCDASRMAQLLQNLIGNALVHGARDQAVSVGARTIGDNFELWVANAGVAIPADRQARLFRPYYRGGAGGEGLGLGLYIASEIAKAHGGGLTVASEPRETRFTFVMPRLAAGVAEVTAPEPAAVS